jgi:uncharacterized protein YheU (UPF0270 family)
VVKIPLSELSSEALEGVIEEFVMREGTDYGHRDYTLDEKRSRVLRALESGAAVITFDPQTGSCSIVQATDIQS